MKINDLLILCLNNLRRRKLRTLLTILGVVIGTTSVVIMLSLGFGINNLTEDMYARYGSMTQINVYRNYNSDQYDTKSFLTDECVKKFKTIDHVADVYPLLNAEVIIKQGVYECYASLRGVPRNRMDSIEFAVGGPPAFDGNDLSMVFGNAVAKQFTNIKTKKSYWQTNVVPDLNYDQPFFVIFDTEKYYRSQSPSEDQPAEAPKKYMIKCSGVRAGDIDDYSEDAYNIMCDIDALIKRLRTIFKNGAIPGQPLTKKGKPYNFIVYNEFVVVCDSMDNVAGVQKAIGDMGYETFSYEEWLEQSKETTNMIQSLLGGIGAVALVVAAIGIANTMMMSIYERTREIGIMKVLGCDMREIRNMFLCESGFIGFFGGIFGSILSFAVSIILNKTNLSAALVNGEAGEISQIPLWLYFAAIGFATLISMIAGLAPALKAMRLSPLTAIRNE